LFIEDSRDAKRAHMAKTVKKFVKESSKKKKESINNNMTNQNEKG
jgi:hypothetical protein